MTFRIGQKVVCVRNAPQGQEIKYSTVLQSKKLKIGSTYTIRDIDMRAVHLHGVATVRLDEIVNETYMSSVGEWETGYPETCFRPIVDKQTDISIFTAMLNTKKVRERA